MCKLFLSGLLTDFFTAKGQVSIRTGVCSKADGKVPEERKRTFERLEKPQSKQFKNGVMKEDILLKMTN